MSNKIKKTALIMGNYLDSFSEPLIVTDENQNIVYANSRANNDLTGGEKIEIETPMGSLIAFTDPQVPDELLALEVNGILSFEEIISHKSGYEYRVLVRVKRFLSEKKTFYSWIFFDYTEEMEKRQQMIDFMAELNQAKIKIFDYANKISVFNQIIDRINQGVLLTDEDDEMIFINSYAKRIFKFTKLHIRVKDIVDSFSYMDGEIPSSISDISLPCNLRHQILVLDNKQTRETKCFLSIFSLDNVENGKKTLVWNFIELKETHEIQQQLIDFSAELNIVNKELKGKNEQILKLSRTDYLTKLNNRRHIIELLKDRILISQREKNTLSIILFDLDRFKNINDEHGHQFGDDVLIYVANSILSMIDDSGEIGRYGGGEFMIVLSEVDIDATFEIAEKMRAAISKDTFSAGIHSKKVTISIGVSSFKPGDTIDSIICRADKALYRAKEAGRDNTKKE